MQYRKFLLTAAAVAGLASGLVSGGFLLGRHKHNKFVNRYAQQTIVDYATGFQAGYPTDYHINFTRIVDVDHDGRGEIVAVTTLPGEYTIVNEERTRSEKVSGFSRTIFILPYKDSGEVEEAGTLFAKNRDSAIRYLTTMDINADGFDEIVLFAEWDGKDYTQIFRYGLHSSAHGPNASPYGPNASLFRLNPNARETRYRWNLDLSREGRLIIANINQDEQLEVLDPDSTCVLGCDSIRRQ